MQVLLQSRRLQIANSIREAALPAQELRDFQMKPKLASEEVSTLWREGANDDMVLAVAVAVREGERQVEFRMEYL